MSTMTEQEWDTAAESAMERGDRAELERLYVAACARIGGEPLEDVPSELAALWTPGGGQ